MLANKYIIIDILPLYKLKCDIDTYVGPNDKLLFYGISDKDKLNNFVTKLTLRIVDVSNNQDVFVKKINFRLCSSYFKDELWMVSGEPFHCFCKLLIEQLTLDLGYKIKGYKYYDKPDNSLVSLDQSTLIRYDKKTSSIIINKYPLEFSDKTEVNFKLNNDSKKQFLRELQNTSNELRQIAWKFITQIELTHKLDREHLSDYCKTCNDHIEPPVDTEFMVREYF